jgi:hypothetical protein
MDDRGMYGMEEVKGSIPFSSTSDKASSKAIYAATSGLPS